MSGRSISIAGSASSRSSTTRPTMRASRWRAGSTFSVQIDPEEDHRDDRRLSRMRRPRRTGRTACAKRNPFEHGPRNQPWMWREARLRDPDGNIIFLYKAGEARRFPPWRIGLVDEGTKEEDREGVELLWLPSSVPSCEIEPQRGVWTLPHAVDAAALFKSSSSISAAARWGRRGRVRAAGRAGRGGSLHPEPRKFPRGIDDSRTCRSRSARRSTNGW